MNRQETKLLVENWRNVLEEGSYDSEKEILEEDWKNKLKNLGLAGTVVAAVIGTTTDAGAVKPVETAEIVGSALSGSTVPAFRQFNVDLEDLENGENSLVISNKNGKTTLISGRDEFNNITPSELEILCRKIKQGESNITSAFKTAAQGSGEDLVNQDSKEIADRVGLLSDEGVEDFMSIIKSQIGEDQFNKDRKYLINKISDSGTGGDLGINSRGGVLSSDDFKESQGGFVENMTYEEIINRVQACFSLMMYNDVTLKFK